MPGSAYWVLVEDNFAFDLSKFVVVRLVPRDNDMAVEAAKHGLTPVSFKAAGDPPFVELFPHAVARGIMQAAAALAMANVQEDRQPEFAQWESYSDREKFQCVALYYRGFEIDLEHPLQYSYRGGERYFRNPDEMLEFARRSGELSDYGRAKTENQ